MEKNRRKRKWIAGVIVALVVVFAGAWVALRLSKSMAARYVQGHRAELNAYVETLLDTDPAQLRDYHGTPRGIPITAGK